VGGNLITASPAADTAPPLLVYEASVLLVGKDTKREVPLNDFFRGPGQTTMKQNELLVEVCLPLMPENTAAKYLKLGKRRALAISVVNAAVRLTLGEKRDINQACIALGSVAPTPYRAADAEKIMGGQMLSEDLIIKAAMEASRSAKPISDIRAGADYRRKMVEVLVRRGLFHAWSELSEAVGHG
jgi:carbon-monoxide dehydrogenase medium subunit